MIQLIVCDIDNTLVVKHAPISDYTQKVITRIKKAGIYFGLASGRSVEMLHKMEDGWQIRCELLIGYNGSEYYDALNGDYELLPDLQPADLKQCMQIMAPFDCNPHATINGVRYARRLDENTVTSASYMHSTLPVIAKDDSVFWQGPATKIGFRVHAKDIPAIEARVAQFPSPDFKGFKTEMTMFEFCNAKASKGKLLNRFMQNHDIPRANVMAFGDMTNDIPLLQAAGIGVCMKNGSADAKAAANAVTDLTVDRDGFADYVEKHVLSEVSQQKNS